MKTLITILCISTSIASHAQDKYFTRNATISFFSSTPMEDIKAENYGVTAVLDAKTGAMEFSALIKSFEFKKALMQEHFNENYMESSEFPKATFKGKIENMDAIHLEKAGSYSVKVSGDLTIHGVTQAIKADGTLDVKDGKIISSSKFDVKPEDFDIEIPAVVREKIAKTMEVSVNANLEPLDR